MKHETMSRLMKIVIIMAVILVLAVYIFTVPRIAYIMGNQYPEFVGWLNPWYIFITLTAVPVLIAAFEGWLVVDSIGHERCFTHDNARRLSTIAKLAFIDAGYFFVGNLVLLFANMNHPGIVLLSLLVVFVGFAMGVAFAALSHLTEKAALMQDDTDLTI